MIGRLNYVAIVVPDLKAAAEVYRTTLGAHVSGEVDQPAHGVTTVFIELPNTKIELLGVFGDKSPISAFLEAQSEWRHPPSLLRGPRHQGSARPVVGARRARSGAGRAGRSALMASRCCSCIRRISAARWSSSSRHRRVNLFRCLHVPRRSVDRAVCHAADRRAHVGGGRREGRCLVRWRARRTCPTSCRRWWRPRSCRASCSPRST